MYVLGFYCRLLSFVICILYNNKITEYNLIVFIASRKLYERCAQRQILTRKIVLEPPTLTMTFYFQIKVNDLR